MNKRDELNELSLNFRKKLYKEVDLSNRNPLRTQRNIVNNLQDTLVLLGHISQLENWKNHEDDAIKLQVSIEKLLKKLK